MWQAVNHALCKATICLWSTLSNSLSVWMYPFCLLCMYNMSMYICICVLSTVGTGALICCIIVLYLLYWIKKKKKRKKRIVVRRTVRSMFGEQTFAQLRTGLTRCLILAQFVMDDNLLHSVSRLAWLRNSIRWHSSSLTQFITDKQQSYWVMNSSHWHRLPSTQGKDWHSSLFTSSSQCTLKCHHLQVVVTATVPLDKTAIIGKVPCLQRRLLQTGYRKGGNLQTR